MIKFNKTTEYALQALRYMSQKNDKSTRSSAREIADHFEIPFEILAKTLQRMKESQMIVSEQGARGGYTININFETVTLGEFLSKMEGVQSVVSCVGHESDARTCSKDFQNSCSLKDVMTDLNDRVNSFLDSIPLREIIFAHQKTKPQILQIQNFGSNQSHLEKITENYKTKLNEKTL